MSIMITDFVDSDCSVGYSSTDPSIFLLVKKIRKTAVSSSIQSTMACPDQYSCNSRPISILFGSWFYVGHFTAAINFTFNFPDKIALYNISPCNWVIFFGCRFSGQTIFQYSLWSSDFQCNFGLLCYVMLIMPRKEPLLYDRSLLLESLKKNCNFYLEES